MKRCRLIAGAVVVMTVGIIMQPHRASACLSVVMSGNPPVAIASEEAIILYDETSGTEQFIRGATFQTAHPDFGFLVPTPTAPTLAPVTDSPRLFDALRAEMEPEKIVHHIYGWYPVETDSVSTGAVPGAARPTPPKSWVAARVQRVGDLDTAVLRASDALSLTHWLTRHGYAVRPAVAEYLAPYIRHGWFITAFRVANDVARERVGRGDDVSATIDLDPIRMTFHTPRPFYPYREASDAVSVPVPNGLDYRTTRPRLRVFYVGTERRTGQLENIDRAGDAETPISWSATVPVARRLTTSRGQITNILALSAASVGSYLTVFNDEQTTRPRSDLFFVPSADQAEIKPPPIESNVYINCASDTDDSACEPIRARESRKRVLLAVTLVLSVVAGIGYAVKRWGIRPLR